jgi:hypothetical protein
MTSTVSVMTALLDGEHGAMLRTLQIDSREGHTLHAQIAGISFLFLVQIHEILTKNYKIKID